MLDRWLRLWFGFRDPVDRGTYFRHGVGLMALKYAIDALLIFVFAHQIWSPFTYLSPLLSVRATLLHTAPRWLLPLIVAIALPFLWIGVSMTMRRAVDAGSSPWIALLFFVPVLNYCLMLLLAVLPSRGVQWPVEAPPPVVDDRLKSAMLGVAASLGVTLLTVGVGVYLRRSYSTGLFLGVPFNIASYALLTMMIAQVCDLRPGEFVHTFGDLHLYRNHLEQAREQLSREFRPLPRMQLNPAVKSIYDFRFEDFTLSEYDPHPAIKAPIAV